MDSKDKKNEKEAVSKKEDNRRKLLKSIVAGGGAATVGKMLPNQWARPVVDSIVIPSHAQTSSSTSPFGAFESAGMVVGMNDMGTQLSEEGFSQELLEFFAPAAQASCIVLDAMRLNSNESGPSYLCADNNLATDVAKISINNNSFTSGAYLFGFYIDSGQFDGSKWVVSISNCGTTVDLFPGGLGCST